MDLYDILKEKEVTWDDLEAATVDEYRHLGKPAKELGDLRSPYGNWLFPHAFEIDCEQGEDQPDYQPVNQSKQPK